MNIYTLNTDNFTGSDLFGTRIVSDVGTHSDNTNNCEHVISETHYSTVFLLQQYGLMLVKLSNVEF
jgi:hypothetical protein